MRYQTIEVDDDVFAYLQSQAVPFVDTPNTVLRRKLLAHAQEQTPRSAFAESDLGQSGIVDLPPGTPAGLAQTLQVIGLTKTTGRSRPEATAFVARHYRVAPQTVLDKYCRQLGLPAARFDAMLREPGDGGIQSLLLKRFPNHRDAITKVFDRINRNT
jgi:hypothetical protein